MKIEIRPAQESDLLYVLANAEPHGAKAVRMMGTQMALYSLMASSSVEAGFIDGEPVSIWGLQRLSLLSDQGLLWMINTPKAYEHPLVFARRSRIMMEQFLRECSCIIGYVQTDFSQSIRWMKWLGFSIGPVYTWHGVEAHYCERKA